MATDKEMRKAREVFDSICKMFDDRDWTYQKEEDDLSITFGVSGEDIPMNFIINCDAQRQLIRLISYLPFKMSDKKLIEGAVATSVANYIIADGNFDYDMHDGSIFFRMTSSFKESLIGKELLEYMVDCACFTIDEFNDQFAAINDGTMSFEEFVRKNLGDPDKN